MKWEDGQNVDANTVNENILYIMDSRSDWESLNWGINGGFLINLHNGARSANSNIQIMFDAIGFVLRIRGQWKNGWKSWKTISLT